VDVPKRKDFRSAKVKLRHIVGIDNNHLKMLSPDKLLEMTIDGLFEQAQSALECDGFGDQQLTDA
jgi:hypothetical protein